MYPQRASKTSIRPCAIVPGEMSSMRRASGFIVGLSCLNLVHADLVTPLALAFKTLREEGFSQSLLMPYLAQIKESRARNSVQP